MPYRACSLYLEHVCMTLYWVFCVHHEFSVIKKKTCEVVWDMARCGLSFTRCMATQSDMKWSVWSVIKWRVLFKMNITHNPPVIPNSWFLDTWSEWMRFEGDGVYRFSSHYQHFVSTWEEIVWIYANVCGFYKACWRVLIIVSNSSNIIIMQNFTEPQRKIDHTNLERHKGE